MEEPVLLLYQLYGSWDGVQDWEAPYMDALAGVAASQPGPVLEAVDFPGKFPKSGVELCPSR